MKDTTKTKHMTGLMDKAIAKVNQNELDPYENLFNTAYSVSTRYSLTTYSHLIFKLKMVFMWEVMFVLTLLKLYLKFYTMTQAQFIIFQYVR